MTVDLFAPYKIGLMELRNRFVRSATWDGTADGTGAVTDSSVAMYRELGQGGVGLIISGFAFISPLAQVGHSQYGAHTDDMIPGLRRLAQAAQRGGAKIALQIVHGGINSNYLPRKGIISLAVSASERRNRPHREMTEDDIEATIADFAAAARRAKEAGFDAVQLHGAHGYLMCQFLSPLFNQRTDRWGGSAENRRRFHIEVLRRIRREVGADFPVLIKFGVQDDREGGLTLSDGLETGRQMIKAGISGIEVSAGFGNIMHAAEKGEPEWVYFRQRTAAVKQAVTVPVMMVGGIRRLETAKEIVASGDADLISMCRPFIREPDLIARWQRGEEELARCISCSHCFATTSGGGGLQCAEELRLRKND